MTLRTEFDKIPPGQSVISRWSIDPNGKPVLEAFHILPRTEPPPIPTEVRFVVNGTDTFLRLTPKLLTDLREFCATRKCIRAPLLAKARAKYPTLPDLDALQALIAE